MYSTAIVMINDNDNDDDDNNNNITGMRCVQSGCEVFETVRSLCSRAVVQSAFSETGHNPLFQCVSRSQKWSRSILNYCRCNATQLP